MKFFPNEFYKIFNNNNQFEAIINLFKDKSNELIKDKEYIKELIKNNKKIYDLANKNYYCFNKDSCIFNNSKNLQILIDAIKEAQNEYDLSNNLNEKEKIKINKSINIINNINEDDEDSKNESSEKEEEIINYKSKQLINKKLVDNRFIIQNGKPIKDIIKKSSKKMDIL